MDAGTMKDYLDDLIIKVGEMETQFNALGEIIKQLQEQRDAYKALYEQVFEDSKKLVTERAEVEHWKKIASDLYQETKRCGTTHDTMACWNYEQWLEDND
jgi:uncharacterized protein YoxC